VFCKIHSHMSATIIVLDHPYFMIPDDDGNFELHRSRPAPTGRRLARTRRRARRSSEVERGKTANVELLLRSRTRNDADGPATAPARADARGDVSHRRRPARDGVRGRVLLPFGHRFASRSPRSLSASQRVFATLETRRQREMVAQTSVIAESPELKAALDTYQSETARTQAPPSPALLETIGNEVSKLASRLESDAIVSPTCGRSRWRRAGGSPTNGPPAGPCSSRRWPADLTASRASGGIVFRVAAVPLQYQDTTIVRFNLATSSIRSTSER